MSRRQLSSPARYLLLASVALGAGLLISFGRDGTWWLLALAGLAWLQGRRLGREISTSGAPLRMFHTVAWALLGLALVALLPQPARSIGDAVVILAAVAYYIGQGTRRAR